MKISAALLIAMLFLAGGCSSPAYYWYDPDRTLAEAKADYMDCRDQAARCPATSSTISTTIVLPSGWSVGVDGLTAGPGPDGGESPRNAKGLARALRAEHHRRWYEGQGLLQVVPTACRTAWPPGRSQKEVSPDDRVPPHAHVRSELCL